MKLQKFKEKNNKQKSIMIFTVTCILLITGVFIYKSFASFQIVENQDLINGSIEDPGDIYFVFYKDNQITKEMPTKGTGYAYDYEKSHCEVPGKEETKNKAIPYFDSIDWSVTVRGMSERPTKCTLYFYQGYQDENLNGADPVLERPLIPVKIDDDGTVRKADPSQKWYDYSQKEWANAVILVDETKQYEVDQEIEEKDIESYFVWIPRYKYKLKNNEEDLNKYTSSNNIGSVTDVNDFYKKTNGNKGASAAFEIEFENITETPSNGTKVDEWLTHPAFTSFNSNGFWVGKFETGYNQNEDTSKEITTNGWSVGNAQVNQEDPSKVIIKPNVYSWRSINVSNAFYTSYNYQRELDSHMMKNTEWGAVAYLAQSKYGRCESDKGPCDEVRINNSSNYVTGACAKNDPSCGITNANEECNHYEEAKLVEDSININNYSNQESGKSSTTGNHSGIYDMSGGAWEFVMSVMKGSNTDSSPASGGSPSYNSGFIGPYSDCNVNGGTENCNENTSNINGKSWPSSKYYDLYDYKTNAQEYQRSLLGDAVKELGPFYIASYAGTPSRFTSSYNADLADFVASFNPWFMRGAAYMHGANAGIFAIGSEYGSAGGNRTFRIVLTP